MAIKVCTANGVCMKCTGTLDSVFEAMNKDPTKKFLCCAGTCIKKDDISTFETVERTTPEDDDGGGDHGDYAGRPELRGYEADPSA